MCGSECDAARRDQMQSQYIARQRTYITQGLARDIDSNVTHSRETAYCTAATRFFVARVVLCVTMRRTSGMCAATVDVECCVARLIGKRLR